jgi:hypothetical protein
LDTLPEITASVKCRRNDAAAFSQDAAQPLKIYPADAEENQLTESGNFVIIIGLSSGSGSFCPPLWSAK